MFDTIINDIFNCINNNINNFVWCINAENFELIYSNNASSSILGINTNQENSDSNFLLNYFQEPSKKILLKSIDEAYQNIKSKTEIRIIDKDGIKRTIDLQVIFNDKTNVYFIMGSDMTELKHNLDNLEIKNQNLEKAIHISRKFSDIITKTSNVIILTDSNANITWVNDAFINITEYSLEESLGKKTGNLIYGSETNVETINILHEGIQKKEITRVEILNYSKNGRKFWLDLRLEPLEEKEDFYGFMIIAIDITKRKNDEIQIKEKNDKIKEFSFVTSHDLRHEFAKIMTLLNASKSAENNLEELKNYLQQLESPVNKINSIISKINSNINLDESIKKQEEAVKVNDEISEICLVDDDQLTNIIHKKIITIFLPNTPVKIFDDIEPALSYLKRYPYNNRIIFLDLNFPKGRSGWDFLDDYQKSEANSPIIVLSSSINNEDKNKSKKYKKVLEYFYKPLTAENLHKYIKH